MSAARLKRARQLPYQRECGQHRSPPDWSPAGLAATPFLEEGRDNTATATTAHLSAHLTAATALCRCSKACPGIMKNLPKSGSCRFRQKGDINDQRH